MASSTAGQPAPPSATPAYKLPRPDGLGLVSGSYLLAAAAIALAIYAGFTDVAPYGQVDGSRVAAQWWMTVAAGGLFQLAVVGWAVGKIMHALSYIGGRSG